MQKKRNKPGRKRILAVLMCFVLVMGSMGTGAFAGEITAAQMGAEEVYDHETDVSASEGAFEETEAIQDDDAVEAGQNSDEGQGDLSFDEGAGETTDPDGEITDPDRETMTTSEEDEEIAAEDEAGTEEASDTATTDIIEDAAEGAGDTNTAEAAAEPESAENGSEEGGSGSAANGSEPAEGDPGNITTDPEISEICFNVTYVKRSWNGSKVESENKTVDSINAVPSDGSMTKGWYYLNKTVPATGSAIDRIYLTGDTYLILGDGYTLSVRGLYIPQGSTLTIYAQSDGKNAGKIVSKPTKGGAAIGATSDNHPGGDIVIHGGIIEAVGDDHCAGIGSNDGNGTTSPITIYGGMITATGGSDGAGIGGGRNCDGGTITIYGGDIHAKGGGENGAGIGGGDNAEGGKITIYGGDIAANEDPNEDGAGIGGGDGKAGGTVTINGGKITCWSRDGAGIGGGDNGDSGTITINGGDITCWDGGHAQGARIGGGCDGDGESITINGGVIHVYNRDGAGIGGGEDGDGGNITITGGEVNTEYRGEGNGAGIGGGNHSGDGGTINISGGTVTVRANWGAGIGGGRSRDSYYYTDYNSGDGGEINISGGVVDVISEGGFGIGAGAGPSNGESDYIKWNKGVIGSSGTITISGKADVTAAGAYAGIGGDSGTINIEGGRVEVYNYAAEDFGEEKGHGILLMNSSEGNFFVSGGVVYAVVSSDDGKAIYINGGKIKITGGTVNATSYNGSAFFADSTDGEVIVSGPETTLKLYSRFDPAIELYKKDKLAVSDSARVELETRMNGGLDLVEPFNSPRITVYPKAMVGYTDDISYSLDENLPWVLRGDREKVRESKTGFLRMIIKPCVHLKTQYLATNDNHQLDCAYCENRFEAEPHVPDENNKCTVCGYQGIMYNVTFEKGHDKAKGEMDTLTLLPGKEYTLPACGFAAPGGFTFRTWSVRSGGFEGTMAPGNTIIMNADTVLTALWEEYPAARVNGVTGSFNDKIKLNYYFDISDEIEGAYVTITNERTGQSVELPVSDAEYFENKGYKFSIPLVAKEASDPITARVYDIEDKEVRIFDKNEKEHTENGVQSSLMKYYEWLSTDEEVPDQERAVGLAAKDYCTAAQIYFNYYADGLSVSSAVSEMSEELMEELNGYAAKHGGTPLKGLVIQGISAMLEADNTLRLYTDIRGLEAGPYEFTIDGIRNVINMRSDNMIYVALRTGVYSNHLQDEHVYSLACNGSAAQTITMSVLTYARACARKKNKKESDLGKALFLYNKAAVAAFGGE